MSRSERKMPKVANKFLISLAVNFYGRRYFSKKIKLIEDGSLQKIEPPYLIVANHASFADVASIVRMLYPKRVASFVASRTQYANFGNILDSVGVIAKRQFTLDTSLIREIKYILSKKVPVVLYPEAKLSVVGTPNEIKIAIAKMVRLLKVPLVTVRFDGSYLHSPRWAKDKRYVPVTATVKVAADSEEVLTLSVDEIYRRIVSDLSYDDYRYQAENNIEIMSDTLVDGLECILYRCPECGKEFVMTGSGNVLTCGNCGKAVTMDKFGRLSGGRFLSVPDWYEWQRGMAREELPSYCVEETVRAEKMVKNKFVDIGEAHFSHKNGDITVQLGNDTLEYPRGTFYTTSFNNKYLFLPYKDTVCRLAFTTKGLTAKINLAVEEYAKTDEKEKK